MEIDPKYSLYYGEKLRIKKNEAKIIGKETFISRETVIKSGGVSIISLPGLNTRFEEYFDGRESWPFEPNPNFIEKVVSDNPEEINSFESSWAGREKLWQMMARTAKVESKKRGQEIDMELLTPYQAVALIGETMRQNIEYDDLVGSDVTEMMKEGKVPKTLRTDLLKLFAEDPKNFLVEVRKHHELIDGLSADKIMEIGFGVCRHMASVALVLYETLKERQKGILLNGTYLAYHGENVGDERLTSVVGNHSYNILVVTTPNDEINLSVIDPTWYIVDGKELDYTWRRISQTCSFITEYGELVGIKDPGVIAKDLAEKACLRLEKYFSEIGREIFLSDYVSLLRQSKIGKDSKKGDVLEYLANFLKLCGFSREQMLKEVLQLPSFVYGYVNSTPLRREVREEINIQLEKINYKKCSLMEIETFYSVLGDTVSNYNIKGLKDLENPSCVITQYHRTQLELIGHYVKCCVFFKVAPSSMKEVLIIQSALNIVRKRKIEGNLLRYGGNYLSVKKRR